MAPSALPGAERGHVDPVGGWVRLLGSKLASVAGLTEVLFAVVFAWLLLGQRLDGIQLAGGALVAAGIALVRLDEMRETAPAVPTRRGDPLIAGFGSEPVS